MKYFISLLIFLLPLNAAADVTLASSAFVPREEMRGEVRIDVQEIVKPSVDTSHSNPREGRLSGIALTKFASEKFVKGPSVGGFKKNRIYPLQTIPERSPVHQFERHVPGESFGDNLVGSRENTSMEDLASVDGDDEIIRHYNRDDYIAERVRQLIITEASYNVRAKIFNNLGSAFIWAGGLATAGTAFVSALGATEHIDSRNANLTTTMLGIASGLCVWAGIQLKTTSTEYHKESIRIQLTLGVPKSVVSRLVDVRVDLPRFQLDSAYHPAQHNPRRGSLTSIRRLAASPSPSRY